MHFPSLSNDGSVCCFQDFAVPKKSESHILNLAYHKFLLPQIIVNIYILPAIDPGVGILGDGEVS
jgi:hypothetical protein